MVCATARWQFLWRPPPASSQEPRYSEQRRGQSLYKEVRYTNGYTGQFSEPVLSSNMNTYISMHLMFYLLFAGMAMTIIIIEWIGHRYFGVSKNSIFYNEVPKVGSAVFVIFVSIALIKNVILFLVLFQHLIYQFYNVAGPFTVIFAGIVEVFFQSFVFANLGEASTTLTAVSIFSLALSHWLMMPLAILHPLIPHRTKASTTTSSTQSPMEEILQRSAA